MFIEDEPRILALYIHIPFCQTRCPYCDFNTYAGIEALMPSYTRALHREIALWGENLSHPEVRTVFFGGGTPSYMPMNNIAAILETAVNAFDIHPKAEVTLEANPGDLTLPKLQTYLSLGINRLSIGMQSLKDQLLRVLGRRHSAQESIDAYHLAQRAGFNNVSIDLIYGVPHQCMEDWHNTLTQALSLEPDHVSLYCLTLEEGTPMERWVRTGQMPQPDPDLAADMYLLAEDLLDAAGYRHYEISNWARPSFESRHNLTYWRNLPYLGVGPGAHSYLGGYRFSNLKSPREYTQRLNGFPRSPSDIPRPITQDTIRRIPTVQHLEAIDQRLEMAETLMLGLRLEEGVSREVFSRRFDTELEQVYGAQVQELADLGLLEASNSTLRLTQQGRLLGNEVFARFLG